MIDNIKTKDLIAKSLLDVLKSRSMEKITVSDLMTECGMTRKIG
jgi:hypothetical protein